MNGPRSWSADQPTPPREVQLAFLDALERGEGAAVWIRRYPQHAATLIDLAQARAIEAAAPPPDAAAVAHVARLARQTLDTVRRPPAASLSAQARQAGLSLRDLAARVGLSSDILFKLDRRVVRPETVPALLLRELATALDCTRETVRLALAGGGPVTAGAFYHAAQAPQVGQQSFAEAVAASVALAPDARARWLAAADGEPAL